MLINSVEPGVYVLAISGGVDSMVLLDHFLHVPKSKIIVAHFDHGIRKDSKNDRQFVHSIAQKNQLTFVYQNGNLGEFCSEEKARIARYAFLNTVKKSAKAKAVVTAHHQDDVLETAIINMLRGTGRKGLTGLNSNQWVLRPFLRIPKSIIRDYATEKGLVWREDPSNDNLAFLRNYVRHRIIPRLSTSERQKFIDIIDHARDLNKQIDDNLLVHMHVQPSLDTLDRHHFIMLPHKVSVELLASWLRKQGIRNFDSNSLERLVIAAKTYSAGKVTDINAAYQLQISQDNLALLVRDR